MGGARNTNKSGQIDQYQNKSSFEKELDQSLLGSRLDQDSYREKRENSFGDSCFESNQLTSNDNITETEEDLDEHSDGDVSDKTHNSEASVDLQVTRIYIQTHSNRDPNTLYNANSEEDQHDGFEDFKIYMNLLQIEMKILLTPCY